MKAQYVQPVRTPATPVDVSRAYAQAIRMLTGTEPKARAIAVLHAHCALETGNMQSCWNNGVGNIKAGENYQGFYTCIRLNERLKQPDGSMAYVWFSPTGKEEPKGTVVKPFHDVPPGHPQTRMRAYSTLAKGVLDKIDFLSEPRWLPALKIALDGDPGRYVRAIRERGYFTAELAPYERAVISLTSKYLPIAEGIAASPPDPVEEDTDLCADIAECLRFEIPDWLRARVQMQTATLGLDDYWTTRKFQEADTDPMQPEHHTGDTEPPGAA